MTQVKSKVVTPTNNQCRWFVVATRPHSEGVARENLERQGYKTLYPRVRVKKRRRGNWGFVIEPMFPGYLFVSLRLGLDDFSPIRSTVGCLGLVKFGPFPKPVNKEVMLPLEKLGDEPTEEIHRFLPGDRLRFEDGPLKGLEGEYVLAKGSDRVEVLMKLLGRESLVTTSVDGLSELD